MLEVQRFIRATIVLIEDEIVIIAELNVGRNGKVIFRTSAIGFPVQSMSSVWTGYLSIR